MSQVYNYHTYICITATGLKAHSRHGNHYSANSYREGILKAMCKMAGVEVPKDSTARLGLLKNAGYNPWTPHQLRHGRGTEVDETHGIQASQAVLGHATLDATQIYTHQRYGRARKVARETG